MTTMLKLEHTPLNLAEMMEYEIYNKGEYVCRLGSFVSRLAKDYSEQDPWRKLYEAHLNICLTTKVGSSFELLSDGNVVQVPREDQ
jgi:hypothetical protein